jgi:hypothetical protein
MGMQTFILQLLSGGILIHGKRLAAKEQAKEESLTKRAFPHHTLQILHPRTIHA